MRDDEWQTLTAAQRTRRLREALGWSWRAAALVATDPLAALARVEREAPMLAASYRGYYHDMAYEHGTWSIALVVGHADATAFGHTLADAVGLALLRMAEHPNYRPRGRRIATQCPTPQTSSPTQSALVSVKIETPEPIGSRIG